MPHYQLRSVLEITTKIECTINCDFCPQELLVNRYFEVEKSSDRTLTLDNFKICINKLPEGTRIDFSGMCEPWLNPECTDMVLYAHEKGFDIAVFTTLTGMKEYDFDRISKIPFGTFFIHIPDEKGHSIIDITDEYLELLSKISNFKLNGKNIVTGYHCHSGIHHEVKKLLNEKIPVYFEIIDRADNVNVESDERIINKKPKGNIICTRSIDRFDHNILLPNGDLLVCCMDYGMKHILGNLLTQNWEEIRVSEEVRRLKQGLADEALDTLCRKCHATSPIEPDVFINIVNRIKNNFF